MVRGDRVIVNVTLSAREATRIQDWERAPRAIPLRRFGRIALYHVGGDSLRSNREPLKATNPSAPLADQKIPRSLNQPAHRCNRRLPQWTPRLPDCRTTGNSLIFSDTRRGDVLVDSVPTSPTRERVHAVFQAQIAEMHLLALRAGGECATSKLAPRAGVARANGRIRSCPTAATTSPTRSELGLLPGFFRGLLFRPPPPTARFPCRG